jgi:hypothetical protein
MAANVLPARNLVLPLDPVFLRHRSRISVFSVSFQLPVTFRVENKPRQEI